MKTVFGDIQTIFKKIFSSGFFHVFGSGALTKIISFLSNIILVRIITKAEYGVFSYTFNIYSIVLLFSGLGAASAMLQFASEKQNDSEAKEKIYGFSLHFGLIANLILAGVVLLLAFVYPFKLEGAQILLFMFTLLPIFQYLNEFQTTYLRCELKNKEYSLLNVLNSLFVLAFSIAGAFVFREKGYIIAQYISLVIVLIIGVCRYKAPIRIKTQTLDGGEKKTFVKFAIIIAIGNCFSQLLSIVSAFLLGIFVPDSTVLASYNAAVKIPTALLFIPTAFVIYIYPYFAAHKDDKKWCLRRFKQTMSGVFALNLLITIILFFGAKPLVSLIFGQQYIDAVAVFRILMINYLIAGTIVSIPGNLLATQRKMGYNLGVNIITGVLCIGANILFVPIYGSIGAAYVVLGSNLLRGLLYLIRLMLIYQDKDFFERKKQSIE